MWCKCSWCIIFIKYVIYLTFFLFFSTFYWYWFHYVTLIVIAWKYAYISSPWSGRKFFSHMFTAGSPIIFITFLNTWLICTLVDSGKWSCSTLYLSILSFALVFLLYNLIFLFIANVLLIYALLYLDIYLLHTIDICRAGNQTKLLLIVLYTSIKLFKLSLVSHKSW